MVPGITSLQALCAAHAIPFNAVGAPVVVTTGRRLREGGWPDGVDSVLRRAMVQNIGVTVLEEHAGLAEIGKIGALTRY